MKSPVLGVLAHLRAIAGFGMDWQSDAGPIFTVLAHLRAIAGFGRRFRELIPAKPGIRSWRKGWQPCWKNLRARWAGGPGTRRARQGARRCGIRFTVTAGVASWCRGQKKKAERRIRISGWWRGFRGNAHDPRHAS